jgi:DNA polymerase-3 subunit beta
MVATDGHRLGYYFHNLSTPVEQKVSSIVSQKSLLHLIRMLSSEEEEPIVHVTLGEKYILFTDTSFSLCSKLIEGPYPDYQKVIPKNNPKNAIIDRVLLQDAVRRVSVLSNRKTHLVKFSYTADTLEITVLNRDIGGEARQVVPVQYDGEDHVIGFNAQYLAEILGIINTPSVRMEMNTQISACLIFPDGDEANKNGSEELFLIMPLRIMEEAV